MKLEKFKEKNPVHIATVAVSTVLVLLTAALIFYKSFALYEQKNSFEIINGQVPDQFYDAMFSFYDGETFVESMPTEKGHNYGVTVSCDNGAIGEWDYDNWNVKNLTITTSRTKCKLIFGPPKPLRNYGIESALVTTGEGLYEVTHEDAEITYTTDTNAINSLKQTEYRYAGKNPNNYVTFNGEEAGWRIIGLVNTPEGQRIKLVRASSIGAYSWDSSASNINAGLGVNEWSQADLKTILNSGAYYNRTSGTCYNGANNATTTCDFSSNGLTDEAKEMIDTITWNLGSNGTMDYHSINSNEFYNYERSNNTGKICSSGSGCTDTVERTTTWKGQIGLMYPSDYGYATSGGSTANRNICMSTNLYSWNDYSDCKGNDWIFPGLGKRLLTPCTGTSGASSAFTSNYTGLVSSRGVHYGVSGYDEVFPTLYLKTNIKVVSGDGTSENPFKLN